MISDSRRALVETREEEDIKMSLIKWFPCSPLGDAKQWKEEKAVGASNKSMMMFS